MSEWITDRRPVVEDAPFGKIWVTQFGVTLLTDWNNVVDREPWMPLTPPEPYVKPKRWTAVWYPALNGWVLRDNVNCAYIPLFDDSLPFGLVNNDDEHREAAERIAAIYEEAMP